MRRIVSSSNSRSKTQSTSRRKDKTICTYS